jgi:hypothetical protein
MPKTLNVNGTQMESVTANGVSMNRVYMNGVLVFEKTTSVVPTLSITPNGHSLPASNPSNRSVTVGSNTDWEVITDAPNWFTITGGSGSGTGSFAITSIHDNLGAARSISLTIRTTGPNPASETLFISQAAAFITVLPSIVNLGHDTRTYQYEVQSDVSWYVTGNKDWITINTSNGNGDDTNVFITMTDNPDSQRQGIVTVRNDSFNVQDTLVVNQRAFVRELSITPTEANNLLNKGQIDIPVNVESNTDWIVGSTPDWFSVSGGSGNGDGEFIITDIQDNTGNERDFALNISTTGANPVSVTFNINQKAVDTLSIEPKTATKSPNQQTYEVDIFTDRSFTVSENTSWIYLSDVTQTQSGVAHINIELRHNTSTSSRTGTITFTAGDLIVTHQVNQFGQQGGGGNTGGGGSTPPPSDGGGPIRDNGDNELEP